MEDQFASDKPEVSRKMIMKDLTPVHRRGNRYEHGKRRCVEQHAGIEGQVSGLQY